MAYLEMTKLSKTFAHADVPAVDGLSLQAERGDFVAIIGPSGCGKSTTLRLWHGLETPDAGTVPRGRRDVTALPPSERDVAMVFQDFCPVPASERLREHRLSPEGASHAPARGGGARARNGRAAGHRGAFGPQAFSALGWPEAARGPGAGPRAQAGPVPDGRAPVEPGRASARTDARRAGAPAPRDGGDHPVRHARPDGSPGAGHEGRRHGPRARAAGRHAGRPAPPSPERVRGPAS